MDEMKRLLENDHYARWLDVSLVMGTPDEVAVEVMVRPELCDQSGGVSPGVLFSLADCAMSLLSNASDTAVAVATHLVSAIGTEGVDVDVVRARVSRNLSSGDATTWTGAVFCDDFHVASFTGTTLSVG